MALSIAPAPRPAPPQPAPDAGLIPTKLHSPRLRPAIVPRRRLTERIEEGLWRKLTLVSAPAGSGKTTLICEWLARTTAPVAWLSLDEADNQPLRFLSYLLGAVRGVRPEVGRPPEALLQAMDATELEGLLAALLAIPLGESEEPFALVLDDYQVIDNPVIHQSLAWLLDNLPEGMHLLITTRQDPPLPLARLRVRDELNEIRAAELRFAEAEARVFFNEIMHLDLSDAEVQAIERRTEGWAAAIQLSALSLRGHADRPAFIQALRGDHPLFADYLVEEVLAGLDPALRDFLLDTAVLERLSAPLCATLTGRSDAQAVLEHLESANLFLIPLDDRRQWYRYHHLFAELLRQRLERDRAGTGAELRRRASRWFEAKGSICEAFHYALQADDQDWLLALAERWGESLIKRSEMETLRRCLAALPDELRDQRPWLLVLDGWSEVLTNACRRAEAIADRGERLLAALPQTAETLCYRGDLLAIRAFAATRAGDPGRGRELSRQALEQLAEQAHLVRGVIALNLGIGSLAVGDLATAETALEESRHACLQAGNYLAAIGAVSGQAWLYRLRGRLTEAWRVCQEALALVERERVAMLPMAGYLRGEQAWVHYERGQFDLALEKTTAGIRRVQAIGDITHLVPAQLLLARVRLALGDCQGALAALEEAGALAERSGWSDSMGELRGCRALAALHRGELADAERLVGGLALADLDPAPPSLALIEARSRLALARGEAEPLPAALERLIDWYEARDRLGQALELRALRVLALAAADREADAAAALEQAVGLARPEGYLRIFIRDRQALAPLLRRLSDPAARTYLAALDTPPVARAAPPAPAGDLAGLPLEPLSARELEVLTLVSRGLANRDIAAKLFVSVGTVKTHLHHILGKLDVRNRTEAVHRARRLGLIEPV